MSYQRGQFGVEWTPPVKEPDAPWLAWFLAVVMLVAVASAVWNAWFRDRGDDTPPEVVIVSPVDTLPPPEVVLPPSPPPDASPSPATPTPAPAPQPVVSRPGVRVADYPPVIRNLLLKLEVTTNLSSRATILGSLRGMQEAAGLEDAVSQELGRLNAELMFERHDLRWIKQVEVRPGDSGVRLARMHGMTLAALAKLNGGSVDRLKTGQRLNVFKFGKPVLVIHRSTRYADVSLDGRFFARYHLDGPVKSPAGSFTLPSSPRAFWAEKGIVFSAADRAWVELLMPPGAVVSISEM